jgi:uncharacterized protein (DUF433 family)
MSEYDEYIDFTEEIPQIKNSRISVLDIVAIKESPYQDEDDVFDYWDLSDEQVEAALKYFKNNKEEIRHLQNKIKNEHYL